jgi:hypothetical protein
VKLNRALRKATVRRLVSEHETVVESPWVQADWCPCGGGAEGCVCAGDSWPLASVRIETPLSPLARLTTKRRLTQLTHTCEQSPTDDGYDAEPTGGRGCITRRTTTHTTSSST